MALLTEIEGDLTGPKETIYPCLMTDGKVLYLMCSENYGQQIWPTFKNWDQRTPDDLTKFNGSITLKNK